MRTLTILRKEFDSFQTVTYASQPNGSLTYTVNAPPDLKNDIGSLPESSFPAWYVHQSASDGNTPSRVVQSIREMLRCDRVTLLRRLGRRWKVIEVSGVTKIHRHSVTIKAIEASCQTLLGPGESVLYPSDQERSESEELAIDQLLDATGATTFLLVLLENEDSSAKSNTSVRASKTSKVSEFALLCERFEGEYLSESTLLPTEVRRSVGVAMENWKTFQSVPLVRLQARLGRSLGVSYKWKLAAAFCILALLPTVLDLIPMRMWTDATGHLALPQSRNIFAPSSATVMQVHVKHGQIVDAGEILLTLESSQILQLQQDLIGQIQTLQKQLVAQKSKQLNSTGAGSIRASGAAPRASDSNLNQLEVHAAVQQIEASLVNLEQQLELVNNDIAKLEVKSPFRGRIVTWDIQERLHQRPVGIGDWLMTIEPEIVEQWRIELELSPKSVAALNGSSHSVETPTIRFRLATAPEQEWSGKLTHVGIVSQASQTYGTAIPAEAIIDSSPDAMSPVFQSGSEVKVLVDCGPSTLWKVLTSDIRHWWNYQLRPNWDRLFSA